MLLSEIAGLTSSEKIFATYAQQFISSGLSSNKIISSAIQAGLGIRRTQALMILRNGTELLHGGVYLQGLTTNVLPNEARLTTAMYPLREKYTYIVKASGKNIITDEADERLLQV